MLCKWISPSAKPREGSILIIAVSHRSTSAQWGRNKRSLNKWFDSLGLFSNVQDSCSLSSSYISPSFDDLVSIQRCRLSQYLGRAEFGVRLCSSYCSILTNPQLYHLVFLWFELIITLLRYIPIVELEDKHIACVYDSDSGDVLHCLSYF